LISLFYSFLSFYNRNSIQTTKTTPRTDWVKGKGGKKEGKTKVKIGGKKLPYTHRLAKCLFASPYKKRSREG
jgi:hypothetical protein